MKKVDACRLQAGDVLEHADHFLNMALAGIGYQQVPVHDQCVSLSESLWGRDGVRRQLRGERYSLHLEVEETRASTAHRSRQSDVAWRLCRLVGRGAGGGAG